LKASTSVSIAGRKGSSALASEATYSRSPNRVVERLDAEAIAGAEERLAIVVPEDEGEHPAQALQARGSPLAVRVENDLGVRAGGEAIAAQLLAQLEEVVDLAIAGDGVAVAVEHRLAASRWVDDAQASMGHAHVTRRVDPPALAVRAAVALEVAHDGESRPEIRNGGAREIEDGSDSAHGQSGGPRVFP
jgi:hypothetical protein